MKNCLFIITVVCFTLYSCGSSKKSSTQEIETVTNVGDVATEIGTALAATLNLNNSQKTSLTGSLSTYLTSINSLEKSVSRTKLNEMKSVALGNIKYMLTEGQYNQLLNIGGKKKSATSISKALKDNSISSEAATVLAELLSK